MELHDISCRLPSALQAHQTASVCMHTVRSVVDNVLCLSHVCSWFYLHIFRDLGDEEFFFVQPTQLLLPLKIIRKTKHLNAKWTVSTLCEDRHDESHTCAVGATILGAMYGNKTRSTRSNHIQDVCVRRL